jgi:hypothetical protein
MMFDIIYNVFMIRYISMYMCLNGTKHMYTVTAEMHRMIYVVFYVRHINMPISVNETEHMYIITAGLHMMVYIASCLDVIVCLYFPKV